MSKFSKIEELYPKDYMNFYESEKIDPDSDSDSDIASEPQPHHKFEQPHRQSMSKEKKKKVRFADQQMERYTEPEHVPASVPTPMGLKDRVINIVRGNLINLVIIIVGFILISNEYTTNFISTNLTTNPIANLAVRSLGLGLMFVMMRTFMTIIFARTS
jgi:hypothetical protein